MGIVPKYRVGDIARWNGKRVTIRGICLRGDNILDAIKYHLKIDLRSCGLPAVDCLQDRYIIQIGDELTWHGIEDFDNGAGVIV